MCANASSAIAMEFCYSQSLIHEQWLHMKRNDCDFILNESYFWNEEEMNSWNNWLNHILFWDCTCNCIQYCSKKPFPFNQQSKQHIKNRKPNQLFYTLKFWKVLKLINSIAIPWKTSESHVKRWLPYVPYSKEKTINNCICCLYGCFFLFVVKKMLAIRFFWVWIFVILKLNTKLTWILKKLHKEWSKNSIKLKAMQYIIVDLGIYSQQKRLH